MSVIIEEMELPDSCVHCPFQAADLVGEYCIVSDDREIDSLGKPEWCPLKETK